MPIRLVNNFFSLSGVIIVYFVWWVHNSCIFQDKLITFEVIIDLVERFFWKFKMDPKTKISTLLCIYVVDFDIP